VKQTPPGYEEEKKGRDLTVHRDGGAFQKENRSKELHPRARVLRGDVRKGKENGKRRNRIYTKGGVGEEEGEGEETVKGSI